MIFDVVLGEDRLKIAWAADEVHVVAVPRLLTRQIDRHFDVTVRPPAMIEIMRNVQEVLVRRQRDVQRVIEG